VDVENTAFAAAERPALGTTARVVVWPPDHRTDVLAAVNFEIERLDKAASRFRPDSELSRTARPGNGAFLVGAALAEAIEVALAAARWTEGRVVPTAGAALEAWGYDRDFDLIGTDVGHDGLPEPAPLPDWRDVELHGALLQMPPGTLLDLGATAKGLGADRAAWAAAGVLDGTGGVLVSLGGDLATAGFCPLGGWPVVVSEDRPDGTAGNAGAAGGASPAQTVRFTSGALATSSVVQRRWRRAGREVHHIIDPATGRPVDGPWRTVTVYAPRCLDANAAATAAIVAGEGAVQWLEQVGAPARLVDREGRIRLVGGWPASDGDVLPDLPDFAGCWVGAPRRR
jgi:thiamine biosynthesis lipoprotein